VRGVPRGAPPAVVARALVNAMSSPTVLDQAELPSWDSCAQELAHVYLASLGIAPVPGSPRWTYAGGQGRRAGGRR
jgi:hypothetical protein